MNAGLLLVTEYFYIVVLLLLVQDLSTSSTSGDTPVFNIDGTVISLSTYVQLYSMQVEHDNFPDNYFINSEKQGNFFFLK